MLKLGYTNFGFLLCTVNLINKIWTKKGVIPIYTSGTESTKREMILTSDMVSQSSVFADKYGPEKAIDKDRDTLAYTICEDGKKVWYKIKFQGEHAVSEVGTLRELGAYDWRLLYSTLCLAKL